jgi:hypothetical protein
VPPKTEPDEEALDADQPESEIESDGQAAPENDAAPARAKSPKRPARKKVRSTPAKAAAKAGPPPNVRRSGPYRTFVAVSMAAVGFAALAVFMTASYIHVRSANATDTDDRTAVATTGSRVAEAMTALDPSGNADQAAVIHALGTGPFVEQYDQGLDSIRKTLGPLNVASVRGSVVANGVYVGDIDHDQAQVIVVVDLVIVGQTTHVVPNQYLRVHLVKLNGVWKVDNVEDLNVSLAASGSAPGSTTTTTVPVPATSSPP